MDKYMVKAFRYECEDEFIEVLVPEGTPKEDVFKNFKMAAKYALIQEGDSPDDYDEYFKEMLEDIDFLHGDNIFCEYLEKACGYIASFFDYDFEFEW